MWVSAQQRPKGAGWSTEARGWEIQAVEKLELPLPEGEPTRSRGRPPALVMMVGLPGTGKSTLARRLAERFPLSIVESDEIRRRLFSTPVYSPRENARVFYVAHGRIARLLREGRDVLFDATNLRESNRRRAYRIAEDAGARLLILRTVAPEEVVVKRLQKRRLELPSQDRSEAGVEVYLRMKGEYQELRRPHRVIDTSGDLEPAIEAAVRFLGEEG